MYIHYTKQLKKYQESVLPFPHHIKERIYELVWNYDSEGDGA